MNKKLFRVSRFLHKWAGLFLAAQIVLWIFGGVIMSVIPIDKVHGDHLAKKSVKQAQSKEQFTYSLDAILQTLPNEIIGIEYTQVLGEPYYIISLPVTERLIHGKTGLEMPAVTQAQANEIAKEHYLGTGVAVQHKLLQNPPMEASRNTRSVWQVKFNDTFNTTLYISPTSGKVTTVRSDIWRLFDFVWMLHIMDYDEREDFNNPLLISISIAALLFTFTGIILLFKSFRWKAKKPNK